MNRIKKEMKNSLEVQVRRDRLTQLRLEKKERKSYGANGRNNWNLKCQNKIFNWVLRLVISLTV